MWKYTRVEKDKKRMKCCFYDRGVKMNYIGYAKISAGDEEEFYFEAPDDATEDQISNLMVGAMWESGVVDVWCEKDTER